MRLYMILIVLFTWLPSLHADTLLVPSEYATIQAAIDASVDDDLILVAPGTYVENLNFLGKRITVTSSDGAEATAIDGSSPSDPDYGSVAAFMNNEDADSVLDGFTLTGGTGTKHQFFSADLFFGGGVFCFEASPTIINNIFLLNQVDHYGGGIGCKEAFPMIRNNVFMENAAANGGGISCMAPMYALPPRNPALSYVAIENNRFLMNTSSYCGGGVYIVSCGTSIRRNLFIENEAGSYGGGIYSDYEAHSSLTGNLFARNSANSGAGLGSYYCTLTLENNTFNENTASFHGGGIYGACSSMLYIRNTILWNNHALQGQGQEIWAGGDGYGEEPSLVHLSYSDLQGGEPGIWLEDFSWVVWGNDMIESDPLFVEEADGDLHITYNSPCRNAGTAAYEDYDFEGDPREYQSIVDIGADEFHPHFYCTGVFEPGQAIKGKFIGLPDTAPIGLFFGSGQLDPPIQHKWGLFHLEAPWIVIPLGVPMPSNGVLEIPAHIPPVPAAPYDVFMQALIGKNPDGLSNLFIMKVR